MSQYKRRNQGKLLLGIVTLFWFAQYVYIPFQTPYLAAAGVSANFIGIIIGAYGISQLILRLPVGVMADVIGKHKFFIVSGGVLAASASLMRIILPVQQGYLIGNILSGFGSAMWISFMIFYTDDVSEDPKEKATGYLVLCNNLGMLCGFVVSTLCYEKKGMTFLCTLSAAAGVTAAIMGLFLQDSKKKEGAIKVRILLASCANKRLILFAFLALVQQGIQVSTTMSYTTQVMKNIGASSDLIGGASIFYMILAVVFAYLASSALFLKIGAKRWIPFIFLLLGGYCVGVVRMTVPFGIFLLQILPGMATGILFTYIIGEAMKGISPEKKSTAMGFFQAFYAIGMTGFPILVGYIVGYDTMKTAFDCLGMIAFFAMFVAIWGQKKISH